MNNNKNVDKYHDNNVKSDHDNKSIDGNSPPSAVPPISLGRLSRFLLSLSGVDLPSVEALLSVETENVAEILLNVEKDAARVTEIADAVMEDLVVYPKKIAEQLLDVASDLEEWAADLDERVAPNLAMVARTWKNLRDSGALTDGFPDDYVAEAGGISMIDALTARVAHEAIYRGMTETVQRMRSMAIELRKADRITAGTRPRRISRNLRVFVVTPLKVIGGEFEENGVVDLVGEEDSDERREVVVDWSFIGDYPNENEMGMEDESGSAPQVEGLINGLSLNENKLEEDSQTNHEASQIMGFGLAGLKQLAASYGQSPLEKETAIDYDKTKAETTAISTSTTTSASLAKSAASFSSSSPPIVHKKKSRAAVVRLNKEMLRRSYPKPKNMFTFLCAQDFRRDEFESHSCFAHDVVDSGLGGWVERRCPLAR